MENTAIYWLTGALLSLFSLYFIFRKTQKKQRTYITHYTFHSAIRRKIKQKYPHLSDTELDLVFRALRDYFYLCNQSKKRMVAMPSQVVDVAWHEFILFTRAYKKFSHKALGRFLHHTPTETMTSPTSARLSIKLAWRLSCRKEGINPVSANRLPLLFAIDGLLNIEDGFRYVLNCKNRSTPPYGGDYCAGHISCTSGCGGDTLDADSSEGFGSADSGFFDGLGGDSGGDTGGDTGGCGGGD